MNWLAATEYLCRRWPRISFVCRNPTPVPVSHSWIHTDCYNGNTTGATCGAGLTREHPCFSLRSPPLVFWGLHCVLFRFSMSLSVCRITTSEFLFDIFKLFLCILYYCINIANSSCSGIIPSRHPWYYTFSSSPRIKKLKHSRQPLTLYTFSSFSGTVHSWYLYCYNYHWSIPLLVDYLFLRVPSA